MLDINVIWDIRKEAIENMKTDSDGDKTTSLKDRFVFQLVFFVFPLLMGLLSWCQNIKLSSIDNFLGTTIAVFTGLFFSLLLSIGGKIKAERDNKDLDKDNFKRFKNNMKQIANIIMYIILVGVIVFILMLLNVFTTNINWIYTERLITSISMFFMGRFILALFFMIQRFRFVVRDEINNIL